MRNSDHDEIDAILDRAMAGYAGGAPLAGLEQRVMNRMVASKAERRRFTPWPWYAAVLVGALASVWVVVVERVPRLAPIIPIAVIGSAPVPVPALDVPRGVAGRRVRKLKTLIVPAGLSAEERALLALAKSEAWATPQFTESIDIGPIQIRPLAIDGLESK